MNHSAQQHQLVSCSPAFHDAERRWGKQHPSTANLLFTWTFASRESHGLLHPYLSLGSTEEKV